MKFNLDINRPDELGSWLKEKGLLRNDDRIESLEAAGEGNMNLTLRARFVSGSLIVKQANPFVQKFPSIPAPVERAEVEAGFLKTIGKDEELKNHMPSLLFHEPENHILVMEDLGTSSDFTGYYNAQEVIPEKDVQFLLEFLQCLHPKGNDMVSIANTEMRALNHFHIFKFPFDRSNGFDLENVQPGLAKLADKTIYSNRTIEQQANKLGTRYLESGGTALLHGDFFPGSWLNTQRGIKIIDPEFCFTGPAEFDLGVLLAHLILCGSDPKKAVADLEYYGGNMDMDLTRGFAATEMLRRIFGVAQLPLLADISRKETLVNYAIAMLTL